MDFRIAMSTVPIETAIPVAQGPSPTALITISASLPGPGRDGVDQKGGSAPEPCRLPGWQDRPAVARPLAAAPQVGGLAAGPDDLATAAPRAGKAAPPAAPRDGVAFALLFLVVDGTP